MNSENVFAILERVIQIPLHQYARYYEKYSGLMASVPTRELVSEQELLDLTAKVAENDQLSQEEIDNQTRQLIFVQKADIHSKTKKGVQERWTFESMVKRSYFHIKPLDDAQKSNWTKYLDWEEEQGDLARIYALYERCLVPCVC
jgi:pre-mRNA-processing factor 39